MSKQIEKFVIELNLAFGNRMSHDGRRVYIAAIERWEADRLLTHKELTAFDYKTAMTSIQREEDFERVPALARVFSHLEHAYATNRRPDAAAPLHTAMDKKRLLECPDGNYKEQCREAFRKGWIESGAPPGKCDAWFNAIDRGLMPSSLYAHTKPQRFTQVTKVISDYDDSPAALASNTDLWSDI